MKKALAMIPLLLLSCQKNETVTDSVLEVDSVTNYDSTSNYGKVDSLLDGLVLLDQEKPKTMSKAFRVIDGDSIIKTINADMIPLTLSDEFTSDDQKYVLKIKNFTGKNITGKITPAASDMNIRFNQIKLANGEFDGPFGLELTESIDKPGEIWLIIGKSLMSSGKAKGKFSVSIK